MGILKASELVLNPEGRVYHLNVSEENLSDTIILFGDQARVHMASKLFDKLEFSGQNRELFTSTGIYKGKRITFLSTGMGTDNIDIVLNELDIAVNVDLKNRILKDKHTALNLIRIGTCGAFQPEINIGTAIASKHVLGFDGMLYFYKDAVKVINKRLTMDFINYSNYPDLLPRPYGVDYSGELFNKLAGDMVHGITGTAPGFYGPQGREIRLEVANEGMNDLLENYSYEGCKFTNLEMETSALYGLGKMLGHNTLTICLTIANRATGDFARDYKSQMQNLIVEVMDKLVL